MARKINEFNIGALEYGGVLRGWSDPKATPLTFTITSYDGYDQSDNVLTLDELIRLRDALTVEIDAANVLLTVEIDKANTLRKTGQSS